MALSAAEKQKRYRERLKKDKIKYEEVKRRQRENYHKKKRLVSSLTPKEKNNARVIWKLRKRAQRRRLKYLSSVINDTPPQSPIPPYVQNEAQRLLRNQGCASPVSVCSNESPKSRGRKTVRRDRSKLYKKNKKLASEMEELKKKYEKYKKRYQRMKNRLENELRSKGHEEKKYKVLSNAINERYKRLKQYNDKRMLKQIFSHPDLNTYRVKKTLVQDALGVKGTLRTRLPEIKNMSPLQAKINAFFLRDDVSRMTAGKKETVTKNKNKVQKRYLLDTMKNLHETFQKEYPEDKCSYFYFTKNKPWNVKSPSVSGREMCLCKRHSNAALKAIALKKKQVLKTHDLSQLILETVCSSSNKDCMYGSCEKCCNKQPSLNEKMIEGKVTFSEWVRKEEKYVKDEKEHKALKNVKEDNEIDTTELTERFKKELKLLKKHVYNMKTQFKMFRKCVDEIQQNEAVILADFSENYNCKYNEEVQAHHFGGSRQQLSLHTVIVYVQNKDDIKNFQALSFCTVSSCNIHQPAAIWAHLDPIIKYIKENYPQVDTLHFFSDGPLTQYRQKQNFFLASTKPFDYGFCGATWSFFEAGHGKGPADGIGGHLKRTADNMVAKGRDIANLEQFVDALKGTSKIQLFVITKADIDLIWEWLPVNIMKLPGTLQVHQIYTSSYCRLKHRSLSCFCENSDRRGFCACLEPKIYEPIKSTPEITIQAGYEEDDLPLSHFKDQDSLNETQNDIGFTDLTIPHKTFYNVVYGHEDSEEENEPMPAASCSDTRNIMPSCGDFLLVKVQANGQKHYKYACLAQGDIEEDGEIKVMFLKAVKGASKFRPDPSDISYIAFEDIIQVLNKPKKKMTKSRVLYEFEDDIDIFEE